jgi:hypothetical protein
MSPSMRNGGVPWAGESPKPGGRDAKEAEGASRCSTLQAASLMESAKNGMSKMCVGDVSPSLASSRTGGQLPLDVGDDGQIPIGELGGSGIDGGVS